MTSTPDPGTSEPRPVADLDDRVKPLLRGVRGWMIVSVLLVLIAGVAVLATVAIQNRIQLTASERQLTADQLELTASCQWWLLLSGLPVTPVPPARMPARLSVSLIAGARVAYQGQRCGPLPAADPSLLHWAAVYRIPVP